MDIITTHKNMDFDALASVFAAKILYPEAKPVLPKSINANVRNFLAMHKDHFPYLYFKEIDRTLIKRLIVVDANQWNRIENGSEYEKVDNLEIHIWDHHNIEANIESDLANMDSTGAATTLLVRQIEKESFEITPIQATLFLAGIYEDTGNLTFPSTTSKDARAVGFLLEQKADLNMLDYFLRPVYGPKQKEVLFEMLQNAERKKINGYTISLNGVDIEGHTSGLALVVAMYRDIINVDAVFGIFREKKRDRCMVIGRSVSEDLDIGGIMRRLGGGGNPNAGSVLLKSKEFSDIEGLITDLLTEKNRQAIQIGDLMSFPVLSVTSDTKMKDVAMILREKGCTGLPVVDEGKLKGVISRRDFHKMRKDSHLQTPVKAFMSSKVITISPENSVMQAARLMVREDIGRLPVVDKERLIGIITRSDAMRYYYDLLPDEIE